VKDAQNDIPAAFGSLTEALKLGEFGGFIRNFVILRTPMVNLLPPKIFIEK